MTSLLHAVAAGALTTLCRKFALINENRCISKVYPNGPRSPWRRRIKFIFPASHTLLTWGTL